MFFFSLEHEQGWVTGAEAPRKCLYHQPDKITAAPHSSSRWLSLALYLVLSVASSPSLFQRCHQLNRYSSLSFSLALALAHPLSLSRSLFLNLITTWIFLPQRDARIFVDGYPQQSKTCDRRESGGSGGSGTSLAPADLTRPMSCLAVVPRTIESSSSTTIRSFTTCCMGLNLHRTCEPGARESRSFRNQTDTTPCRMTATTLHGFVSPDEAGRGGCAS